MEYVILSTEDKRCIAIKNGEPDERKRGIGISPGTEASSKKGDYYHHYKLNGFGEVEGIEGLVFWYIFDTKELVKGE